MAEKFEKVLNTRIVLKHDDLANWEKDSVTLKDGEIALVRVASADKYAAPTYLMKVGDNNTPFTSLNWVAANAADVHAWAKKAKLDPSDIPPISMEKIQGLDKALEGKETAGEAAKVQDNLNAHINSQTNPHKVTAEQVGLGNVENKSVAEIKTALTGKIASENKNFVTGEAVHTALAGKEDAGAATTVQNDLDAYKGTNDTAVQANAAAITEETHRATEAEKGIATNTAAIEAYKISNDEAVKKITDDYLKSADKTELTQADAAQVERIVALEGKIDGVTGAMHFVGISTTDPAKGTVTINDEVYQGKSGDTVIYKTEGADTEFVYDGSAWVELGDTTQEAKDITANKKAIEAEVTRATKAEALLETKADATQKLTNAKAYTDELANGDVATNTANISKNTKAIAAIEAKAAGWDTAADKANSAVQKVAEGDTNGTIKVDGTAVSVHGLGTAAYTASSAYATAKQGEAADSALQKITTTNKGGLKVTDNNNIDFDPDVVFVFDCGNASTKLN